MPVIVYIFTLSAFALGLAEFVAIGLTEIIAQSLNITVEQAGGAVTLYALGATVAAPILTVLTAKWSRKRTLLMTMLLFTLGSAIAALSTNLTTLLVSRFVAGLGQGLFLAVASSTAARLVGPAKAGSAVAVVFSGFTVAIALGAPISTYLGGLLSWRPILAAVAVFGAIGFVGLLSMKEPTRQTEQQVYTSAAQAMKTLFHPLLLLSALVTVLGFSGSFAAYTYIAPLLTEETGIDASSVGFFMLLYGVSAAIGNIIGGKLTDKLGVSRSCILVMSGITVTALGIWIFANSAIAVGIFVSLLGFFTFASVPALQTRLIGMATQYAPHTQDVAAGLNIAGFNLGIALGSALGGITISTLSVAYTGFAGAVSAALGLMLLMLQLNRKRTIGYHAVKEATN